MSLRTRLLLAVGVVAFVALVVADVVTYSSLHNFLSGRIDQTLEQTLQSTSPPVGDGDHGPADQGGGATPSPDDGTGGTELPANLPSEAPGTFVEIRSADGTVLHTVTAHEAGDKQYSPALPTHITVPAGSDGHPGTVLFTTSSTVAGGPQFRVLAASTSNGMQVIFGLPLDSVDATLQRLLLVELVVTLAALAAAIALGWWLVRVGLRPLVDVEVTAEAIAEGELDRRIPGEEHRTEVGRLARVLNLMLARIERAFAERDATEAELRASEERLRRFVADASHELRTPLAAVSAYAELFTRGANNRPEDLERVMAGIRGESARMARLVEDLLLLARLDEGQVLDVGPVELVGLAAEARDAAQTVGPEWPVRLVALEPVEVAGDRHRLRQVLDNLLTNVRAHTPSGTATTISVGDESGAAVIEVADDGPGLDPEQAAKAFERFYRVDPSRSRDRGGAGLGLSIVAAIVASHGGTVSAGRSSSGGAVFTVRLPRTIPLGS